MDTEIHLNLMRSSFPERIFDIKNHQLIDADTQKQVTQKEIDKIQALEPLRLLKIEVSTRLTATDIHALADQTLSPEMRQYRTDLRLCYRNAQAGIGTLPTLDVQDQLVYSGFPFLPVPPV